MFIAYYSIISLKKPSKNRRLRATFKTLYRSRNYCTKAERDSIEHAGQVYLKVYWFNTKGSISGVTDRGVFIELVESKCEGFVHIQTSG